MLLKQKPEPTNKFIVNDEESFHHFIRNQIDNISFYSFDEEDIEKKLPFYLKVIETLSHKRELKVEIKANSPLILIALPLLKKIANLELIELTATRGKRPEEIIKAAKAIRSHNLPVKVRYIKR